MDKKISIELTVAQLNAVIQGLAKLPIELGLDAYMSVTQQAEAQLGKPGQAAPSGPLSDKVIQ